MEVMSTKGESIQIDEEDFPKVSARRWYVVQPDGKKSYAMSRGRDGKTVYLHRLVMDVGPGEEIDHKNGDGLDNRKHNLRIATRQQNCANTPPQPSNTSGFKGVYWRKERRSWVALIQVNRRQRYIGSFRSKEDAARAYDRVAHDVFGEFAYLNFPDPV